MTQQPLVLPDAHMCEVLYAHYADRLTDSSLPLEIRRFLEKQQAYWVKEHAALVPIEAITTELLKA